MASDDEEEAYEVERILAEKPQDGETKYLVKWKGYDDEECTWEPLESFDTTEVLDLWKKQKADGDVLEKEDLRRIELQMDAFQKARSANSNPSEHSSEGDSDPESDELLQPPAKRVKLVHDPPPLSNKSRGTKVPTRTGRATAERNETARPLVSRKTDDGKGGKVSTARPVQKSKQDATHVAGRSSLSHSNIGSNTGSLANKSTRQPTNVNKAPPTIFYAPELSQRKRGPSNANAKRDVAGAVGKPFRNLKHQHNARKRQAENFEHLPSMSIPNPLVEQDEAPTQVIDQVANEQANDSWLFFSEDEACGPQRSEMKDRHKVSEILQASEPGKADVGRSNDQAVFIKPEETPDRAQAKILLASSQNQANPGSLVAAENDGQKSQSTQIIRQPTKAQPESKDDGAVSSGEITSDVTRTENGTRETDLQSRRTSGLDRDTSMGTDDLARAAMPKEVIVKDVVPTAAKVQAQASHGSNSFSQPAPPVAPSAARVTTAAVATNIPSSHPQQLAAETEAQPPQWQPRHDQATSQIHPSREQVLKGGIVRTPGRTWVKGDLVVELHLDGHLAGGVKIQNAPWPLSSNIVRLKPKKEHDLPVHFNGIAYEDYQARSKQASWWTVTAVGAVEAFLESENQISLMASHLETYDIGAYWSHPDPTVDLMLVLYSCRSRSWAGISTHQQTRSGDVRLNLAFRNKFKQLPLHSIQQEPPAPRQDIDRHVFEDRDADMTDTRTDFRREPRSRRASVVSNSSSRAYEDAIMSPSEQLTREMPDHALSIRSRQASNATDRPVRPSVSLKAVPRDARQEREDVIMAMTASPKELISPVMGTDPRARTIDPRREPSANRTISSPVSHQTRKDTIVEQLDTSATNSPIQDDTNPCLDRPLKELSQRSGSDPSKEFRSNIRILLVYKEEDIRKAQEVQEWLAKQVVDSNQVQIQPVSTALDDTHEAWKNFKLSAVKNKTCVLVCDVSCPIYRFDSLGKLMVHNDNVICWQVDLKDTDNQPLTTTRLFPTGWAMALTHDCFLMGPDDAKYALKWLKKRVEKTLPASVLMLPPHISSAIQEQALVSSLPETKTLFLELAALIQQLIALSETQLDGLGTLGFTVILPRWEDVYSDNVPISNQLSAVEQKLRDKTMSDEFLKYFGAWAMRNLTKHRGFIGLTMDEKPKNNEHVRFRHCKEFVMVDRGKAKLVKEEKEKERQRSKSRDPSIGRERERERGRSQDRNANDRSRAESRGRV